MDQEILLNPSVIFILTYLVFALIFTVYSNFEFAGLYLSLSHCFNLKHACGTKMNAMLHVNKHLLSICFGDADPALRL